MNASFTKSLNPLFGVNEEGTPCHMPDRLGTPTDCHLKTGPAVIQPNRIIFIVFFMKKNDNFIDYYFGAKHGSIASV